MTLWNHTDDMPAIALKLHYDLRRYSGKTSKRVSYRNRETPGMAMAA